MSKNRVELRRIFDDNDKQIRGYVTVLDENNKVVFECLSLERAWKGNKTNVSSIPTGTYPLHKRNSPAYGYHFHIYNVPNRWYILIHHGNYWFNTKGCVIVGKEFRDINNDNLPDVTDSKKTLRNLLTYLDERTTITIT